MSYAGPRCVCLMQVMDCVCLDWCYDGGLLCMDSGFTLICIECILRMAPV